MSQLVLNDISVVDDPQFTVVSRTAEKWVDIKEVCGEAKYWVDFKEGCGEGQLLALISKDCVK